MSIFAPMVPEGKFQMIAKTTAGFEHLLAEELRSIGATGVVEIHRAVSFWGDKELMYKANLWLRTALRILMPIRFMTAANADELYEKARQIDWTSMITVRDTFAIDATTSGEEHHHSQFAAMRLKDAIADQFREHSGHRPSVDLKDPTLRINLHIMGNEVSIALDSSGDSLHKRGYRLEKSAAPLNEVLAAGMIMLTGWDRKSNFVDPMCGSGTLPIEAAWMAMNVAPGLRRDYAGFKNWKDYDERLWRGLIEDAKSKIVEPEGVIYASEISQGAVDISRRNITRAGLLSKIQLHCRDFRKIKAPEGTPGVLVANPPYGERIQIEDIEKFYEEFGDVLKKQFMGYDAWILTANQAALKRLGLKASKKIPLMNGPIECRFQKYEMYVGTREPKGETEKPM